MLQTHLCPSHSLEEKQNQKFSQKEKDDRGSGSGEIKKEEEY